MTKNYKLFGIALLLLSFFSSMVFAQTTYSGKITDEKGLPLPGVSVKVKNLALGEVSDANGKFTLHAPDLAVLTFTYVGYLPQEITLSGQKVLNISMKPEATEMDEVVVVGKFGIHGFR